MGILDYLFYFSEILAAISGLICMKYLKSKASRYFVFFLCITVLVETFGMLSMRFEKWHFLDAYRNSRFIINNYWLYNFYYLFNYAFYTMFFRSYIIDPKKRKTLAFLVSIYMITSFFNLMFSGVLFESYSSYNTIFGTFLILISVFMYFFEMLKSDKILKFYKNIEFYVAIGALTFHLCTTPLFIYSKYFKEENDDFLSVYYFILPLAIIFMYTCYTIGFIICSRKNKSY